MYQLNKYITYLRKSSESEDRQIQSIERQHDETCRLIEIYKANVVETIAESRSAMMPHNRPGFTKMVKMIERGEANGIICWHVNRLSRNPYEWGIIHQLLIDKKLVSIITKDREYTPDDNILVISVESGLSTQYSRDLGKAVKSGLEKKIAQGQPPGSAPLGYLNTKSSIRGSNTIIPDPERWPIIRKAFELLLTGAYTAPKIVDIVNNDYGLKTRPGRVLGGKPMSRSTLYRIFSDPFYYGYFLRKGVLYKGRYPAMITVDEFDKVQALLGRYGKPRPKQHTFYFTGLIRCGACGASITACRKTKLIKRTGELKTYSFYHCTKRKKDIHCPVVYYMHEEEMEQMIVDELNKYQIKECFKKWALDIIHEQHAEEMQKQQALLQKQQKLEEKIHRELNQLLDMRISNEISPEIYLAKKKEKEDIVIRVQAKRSYMEENSKHWILEVEDKLNFVTNVVNKFKNGDAETKKEICHRFGWNWVLKDRKLLIDKQEWLEPIKNYKDEAEGIFGALEPEKIFMAKGRNASFEALRPIVRALVDEVGTRTN